MHANLMRAASFQRAAHTATMRVAVEPLDQRARCLARVPLHVDDGHPQTVARVAADRRIDLSRRTSLPRLVAHREILALDLAGGDQLDQRVHRGSGACHHHQAARVLVEPVHDAGTG